MKEEYHFHVSTNSKFYPLFVKSKTTEDIFLFVSLQEGIKLTNNGKITPWNSNWVAATDTEHWQHLTFAEAEAELFESSK